jgi:hypothetical protein
MSALEERDGHAAPAQFEGAGEPGRPGANDRHAASPRPGDPGRARPLALLLLNGKAV